MYPLSAISSLTDGNLTVNGSSSTYFSVLTTGDEVVINDETVEVDTVYNDSKFTVKTAFTTGSAGDILYSVSKCVWLKYQIWKIDIYISNSSLSKFGLDSIKNGQDEIQFDSQNSSLSELLKLRKQYVQELKECEAEANGESIWTFRRYETGTF